MEIELSKTIESVDLKELNDRKNQKSIDVTKGSEKSEVSVKHIKVVLR